MFIDEARIHVASGRGGDGMVHFRREKYVPRGGPDGGDGGRGGDVVLDVAPTLNTLSAFRRRHRFRARDGGRGGSSNKTGRDGEPVVIPVPPGSLVWDEASGDLLADLVEPAQRLVVCRGGRGGRGNARFATARNQAPRRAERGEPGQERWLRLELRLIADVGIVGVPNAGKSTLLAAVTNARPKIADYPFTTLEPILGVADLADGRTLVLADIPGLIEGAHRGAGLGTAFLRHIQRTRALIHLVDGNSSDPLADFSQVNGELALFDPGLKDKPQVVAVNKMDLQQVQQRWPELRAAFRNRGHVPLAISALARSGVRELLLAAARAVERAPRPSPAEVVPVYRPEPEATAFEVRRDPDGVWRVVGKAIERAAEMTYWEHDEAVRHFQRLLMRLGVEDALRRAGARSGDTVRIGEYELEWQD
ncbi:MAG: GTPase ObgE [Chloroflexota bacterium]